MLNDNNDYVITSELYRQLLSILELSNNEIINQLYDELYMAQYLEDSDEHLITAELFKKLEPYIETLV